MDDEQQTRPRIVLVNRSIVIKDGVILLIQRSKNDTYKAGMWEFPGGKLDAGQDLTNALEREVLEETGLLISPIDRIAYYESIIISGGKYAGMPYVSIIGISKVSGGEIKLSEEHDDYVWLNIQDAKEYNITDDTRKALITLDSKLRELTR